MMIDFGGGEWLSTMIYHLIFYFFLLVFVKREKEGGGRERGKGLLTWINRERKMLKGEGGIFFTLDFLCARVVARFVDFGVRN